MFDAKKISTIFFGGGEQQIRVARWTTRIRLLIYFLFIYDLFHLLENDFNWLSMR